MGRLGRMDDTYVIFTSDQGEPLGEHGFVRRFRPWLYEELIHTPLDHPSARRPARRKPPSSARADRRPAPHHRFGTGHEADRGRPDAPRPRPAPLDPWRARQGARLRVHGNGSRRVRDPDPPLAPDPPDRDRPGGTAIHRALPQARGSLGPEQRHRAARRSRRAPRAGLAAIRREPAKRGKPKSFPRCATSSASARPDSIRAGYRPARVALGRGDARLARVPTRAFRPPQHLQLWQQEPPPFWQPPHPEPWPFFQS